MPQNVNLLSLDLFIYVECYIAILDATAVIS